MLGNLLVDLDDNPSEKSKKASNVMGPLMGPLSSSREQLDTRSKESALQMKPNLATDGLRNAKAVSYSSSKIPTKERGKSFEDSGSDSDTRMQNNSLVRNMEKNVKGRENYRMKDASFQSNLGATLQPYVDKGLVAGLVTLVASREGVLSMDAVGFADIAGGKAMTPDAMFWVASQTKPMTPSSWVSDRDSGFRK